MAHLQRTIGNAGVCRLIDGEPDRRSLVGALPPHTAWARLGNEGNRAVQNVTLGRGADYAGLLGWDGSTAQSVQTVAQRRAATAASPDPVYTARVLEAIGLLEGARFGRADWDIEAGEDERYDTAFWKKETVPTRRLVLLPGKLPSNAIDAMFADLDRWSVDCAEFVQIVQWYALRHAYGAKQFDERVKGLSFELRPHGSTGVDTKKLYQRNAPTEPMALMVDGKPTEQAQSVDQLVINAPVGSRVTWTNLKAPSGADFKNENAIRLGKNIYGAHGFSGTANVFTREQIEEYLAHSASPSLAKSKDVEGSTARYIEKYVYIAAIEIYVTP